MRIPRIYIDQPLAIGKEICLKDDLSHRLLHVLRVKPGYKLYLFNGSGDQFLTSVKECTRKSVLLSALGDAESLQQIESPLQIHLAQAISKSDKMDWAIQKAVEMGVTEITPLVGEYTHLKRSQTVFDSKWQHFYKVMLSAVEQSGRGITPKLNPITEINAFLSKQAKHAATTFYLSPRGEALNKLQPQALSQDAFTLLIGGEGGFSETEEARMAEASFNSIKLGPRILRTETAPVAVIALLQYLYGDFAE